MTDWANRSAGADFAVRLDQSGDPATYAPNSYDAGNSVHVSFDSTIKPDANAAGSMKFLCLNSDGNSNGLAGFDIGPYDVGDVFWTSFRVRVPPELAYQHMPAPGHGSSAYKLCIISGTPTNQEWEVVVDVYSGAIQAYHQQNGGSSPGFQSGTFSSGCSGTDIRFQPSIDNSVAGAGNHVYPLTGTDADDGSAWSTCQQARARYGSLYSTIQVLPDDYAYGFGDPISGRFRLWPNEWITVTVRIQIGAWDDNENRVTGYLARENQPYIKFFDDTATALGGPGPYSKLWLLPGYIVDREEDTGRKITGRTTNITGVTLHTVGLGTPVGDGSLFWDVSEQKLQWKGAGETYGTARGFSAANEKLTINLFDSVAAKVDGSNICLTIDPASLPGSDQTDTVTIADGRPDTYAHVADVIVSTKPINAPGGYSPTALGQLILDLDVGEWGTLTTTNIATALGSADTPDAPGASGSILGYTNAIEWDRISQKFFVCSSDHYGEGFGNDVKLAVYDDISNSWSNVATDDWIHGVSHGYANQAVDPVARKFYTRQDYGGDGNSIRAYDIDAGGWTTLSNNTFLDYSQIASAMRFFPGYGLIWVQPEGAGTNLNAEVYRWSGSAWSQLGTNITMGHYSLWACYSPTANLMFFGGGGDETQTFYKMTSSGTITQMNDAPVGLGTGTGIHALIIGDPVEQYLHVFPSDGSHRRYNIVGDTWTTIEAAGTNRFDPILQGSSDKVYGCVGGLADTYGAAFVAKWYPTGGSNVYVLKLQDTGEEETTNNRSVIFMN